MPARQSCGVCALARCFVPVKASRRDQTVSEWRDRQKEEAVTSFTAVVPEGVHHVPPQPRSFTSVRKKRAAPRLPDWKQHHRFMTSHRVRSSLPLGSAPAWEMVFGLGNKFPEAFHKHRRFRRSGPGVF